MLGQYVGRDLESKEMIAKHLAKTTIMKRADLLAVVRNVLRAKNALQRNLSLITETKIKTWIRTANLLRDLERVKTIVGIAAVRTSSCKIRTFTRTGTSASC